MTLAKAHDPGSMAAALLFSLVLVPLNGEEAPFVRGDSNMDGTVDISDPLTTLGFLFLGLSPPPCPDASDANDDGTVDIADPIATLQSLFQTAVPLPPPGGVPGEDPTPDRLACDIPVGPLPVFFLEILQVCMDRVSMGGSLQVVIRNQEEYRQLIYERFQKPLDDYWNAHYEDVKARLRERFPGITEEELERRVREAFYSVLPFRGTENCKHPEIDFSVFTLLGQAANASGCSEPVYAIEVLRDHSSKEYLFRIDVEEQGFCEMAILRNKWILVPKIPPDFSVRFETQYTQRESNP